MKDNLLRFRKHVFISLLCIRSHNYSQLLINCRCSRTHTKGICSRGFPVELVSFRLQKKLNAEIKNAKMFRPPVQFPRCRRHCIFSFLSFHINCFQNSQNISFVFTWEIVNFLSFFSLKSPPFNDNILFLLFSVSQGIPIIFLSRPPPSLVHLCLSMIATFI